MKNILDAKRKWEC